MRHGGHKTDSALATSGPARNTGPHLVGLYIFDHVARFGEAVDALTELMLARGLNHDEEIDHGIAHAPASLAALFAGTNLGKKLIFVG